MAWQQLYNPLGSIFISALVAAIPVAVMLIALAFLHMRAHLAAISALVVALVIAIVVFGMPVGMAARAAGLGIASGLFPIGWIVLNIIFLYRLTVQNGSFAVLFVGLLLPVALVAGALGAGSLWWRLRRARRQGGDGFRFVVIRR